MKRITRRAFIRRAMVGIGSVAGLSVGGGVYALGIEPAWLDIAMLDLSLPRLARQFDGYRVAHLSDIHMDGWMNQDRLASIVQTINQLAPDLVAITGDFVTGPPQRYAGALVSTLRTLAPRDAVVAVLGNHDHWTDPSVVRQALRDSGVRELPNIVQTIERDGAALHLCGVDDVLEDQHRLDDVVAQLPGTGAAVLLAHEPDFADQSAATGRFDLQLSGHSHGGQVWIPLLGPPVLPPLARKYPAGLYTVGTMLQYTTRGVGMLPPQVRFNCRPELTLLTLRGTA